MIDRFIRLGERIFSDDPWHRVPFQPILYLMLWGAVLRMATTDTDKPIPFDSFFATNVEEVWVALGLTCPPLALVAWWLITKCRWKRSSLAGLWVRLGADAGQFMALLTYHIAVAFTGPHYDTEGRVYARYVVGAAIMFVGVLVIRDIWALTLTEKLAGRIRRHRD